MYAGYRFVVRGEGLENGCAYPEVEGRDQGCVDGKGAVNGTDFEMNQGLIGIGVRVRCYIDVVWAGRGFVGCW